MAYMRNLPVIIVLVFGHQNADCFPSLLPDGFDLGVFARPMAGPFAGAYRTAPAPYAGAYRTAPAPYAGAYRAAPVRADPVPVQYVTKKTTKTKTTVTEESALNTTVQEDAPVNKDVEFVLNTPEIETAGGTLFAPNRLTALPFDPEAEIIAQASYLKSRLDGGFLPPNLSPVINVAPPPAVNVDPPPPTINVAVQTDPQPAPEDGGTVEHKIEVDAGPPPKVTVKKVTETAKPPKPKVKVVRNKSPKPADIIVTTDAEPMQKMIAIVSNQGPEYVDQVPVPDAVTLIKKSSSAAKKSSSPSKYFRVLV